MTTDDLKIKLMQEIIACDDPEILAKVEEMLKAYENKDHENEE